MPKKPRGAQTFQKGETVLVMSPIQWKFNGKRGVISKVQQSIHASSLDRYTVRIENSPEKGVFWDIELERSNHHL